MWLSAPCSPSFERKHKAGESELTGASAPPLVEIPLPELAEGMAAATLSTWLKKPGDPVAAGEPIAEVETDKTTVELEAPADGVLADIRVAAGAEAVAVGTVLALVRKGRQARPQRTVDRPRRGFS